MKKTRNKNWMIKNNILHPCKSVQWLLCFHSDPAKQNHQANCVFPSSSYPQLPIHPCSLAEDMIVKYKVNIPRILEYTPSDSPADSTSSDFWFDLSTSSLDTRQSFLGSDYPSDAEPQPCSYSYIERQGRHATCTPEERAEWIWLGAHLLTRLNSLTGLSHSHQVLESQVRLVCVV